ncbi:TetR/AcrR family transcriptional regulator [Solimicrobium silvestre]|uniref:Bacterial regulatory protein, tetR family n=1 Tax=Solimicrobium silvestre TaxID=2099400 RepID=A0A2S9GSM9_9BURK|nr:TetR family transcriptional regulator [Solimicrobium silvestre]PRC90698.1 Bacterial regulatory protein, tetR family [Solimicrobium silvestre]
MTKTTPTNPTRLALLEHGKTMARQHGLRSITVRGLCQETAINTGSFVYHFGSRDQFIAELIEYWYAPLFEQIQWQQNHHADPLTRLHAMLRQLLSFVNANGAFIAQLMQDVVAGEIAAQRFTSTLAPRHPRILLQCIADAQQAGQLCIAPPLHQAMFLMSACGIPILLQHVLSGKELLPELLQQAIKQFATDPQHIDQRLQWALQGLMPNSKEFLHE